MQRLWGEMRGQFQGTMGTNDSALEKAIAEKLNISLEVVSKLPMLDIRMPLKFAEKVQALPHLNPEEN